MATILNNKIKELELVKSAQNGNSEAFGFLYDAYISQIYNFIYYKTLQKEIAEDIAAEVFLKAWQKINQFKEGSFIAWLYTIARNKVIDYYRRYHDCKDINDCWDLKDSSDLISEVDLILDIDKLKKYLRLLKNEDRELLIMRFWQELSFAEIAERLGKTEGAVKMSCSRALDRLRSQTSLSLFILLPTLINLWKTN